MAHDKRATPDYVRQSGVDIWPLDNVHSLVHVTNHNLLGYLTLAQKTERPVFVADVGDDYYLLGFFPQGVERARQRFPKLRFRPLRDREVGHALVRRAIECYRRVLEKSPDDWDTWSALAAKLLFIGDASGALEIYKTLVRHRADDDYLWHNLGTAYYRVGDGAQAIAALEQACALARDRADQEMMVVHGQTLEGFRARLRSLEHRPPQQP
ncbi:MAG: hypothetical protein V2A79_08370 [Planctomycetota bacterium]